MHRRNRTACTFGADKGEKKKVLAQPGGRGRGRRRRGRSRDRAKDSCLPAPVSKAKQG